jgi:hypothetical protein
MVIQAVLLARQAIKKTTPPADSVSHCVRANQN